MCLDNDSIFTDYQNGSLQPQSLPLPWLQAELVHTLTHDCPNNIWILPERKLRVEMTSSLYILIFFLLIQLHFLKIIKISRNLNVQKRKCLQPMETGRCHLLLMPGFQLFPFFFPSCKYICISLSICIICLSLVHSPFHYVNRSKEYFSSYASFNCMGHRKESGQWSRESKHFRMSTRLCWNPYCTLYHLCGYMSFI